MGQIKGNAKCVTNSKHFALSVRVAFPDHPFYEKDQARADGLVHFSQDYVFVLLSDETFTKDWPLILRVS